MNSNISELTTNAQSLAPLPGPSGALSAPLQDCARRYIAAQRRSGEALLEACAALAAARELAQHGEWGLFLTATRTSEGTAKRLLDIHSQAQQDAQFAEAVRSNWIGATVAGELAQPSFPPEVREQLLSAPEPPTRADVLSAKSATVAEMDAAPFWQSMSAAHPTAHLWTRASLNTWRSVCGMTAVRPPAGSRDAGHCSRCAAAPAPEAPTAPTIPPDIRAAAARLGLVVESHDGDILLYWSDEADDVASHIIDPVTAEEAREWLATDALAQYERRQAKVVEPAPHHPCEHCGAAAVEKRPIGGIHAWRCLACAAAQQQADRAAQKQQAPAAPTCEECGGALPGAQTGARICLACVGRKAQPQQLSLDTKRRLVAAGAAILPDSRILPPKGSGEIPRTMDETEAAAALERWARQEAARDQQPAEPNWVPSVRRAGERLSEAFDAGASRAVLIALTFDMLGALAGDDLTALAGDLDTPTYEALAVYRARRLQEAESR